MSGSASIKSLTDCLNSALASVLRHWLRMCRVRVFTGCGELCTCEIREEA